MFDPMKVYHASGQTPIPACQNLDEEQLAQRRGHVVASSPLWNRTRLRVGKLLIRIGEKLAAENTPIEWSKETA